MTGLLIIYVVLFVSGDPIVANAIGYGIGIALSFVLNRIWTFEDDTHIKKTAPRFLLVVSIAYLCNLAAVVIGTREFAANAYLIQLLGIGIYTALTFIGYRCFVFPGAVRTAHEASRTEG